MYTQLTQLSLLQGMNAADIAQIQKQALIYDTVGTNVVICKQGEVCTKLHLLLKGSMIRKAVSPNGDYEFEELIQAPWIIEPESLYGLHCAYSSHYTTREICTLMVLSKHEMAKLFTRNDIFRMNYLNLLSADIQRQRESQLLPFTSSAPLRIIHLISTLSSVPNGSKTFRIKMDDLSQYMNETRLNVSRILNQWKDMNLVKLQRKEIQIPRLENLISHVISTQTTKP